MGVVMAEKCQHRPRYCAFLQVERRYTCPSLYSHETKAQSRFLSRRKHFRKQ